MQNSSDKIFIGTMSGTSHDGIDICAMKFSNQISLLKFNSYNYTASLKRDISEVIQQQELSVEKYFELNNKIGFAFSRSIRNFLAQHKINKKMLPLLVYQGRHYFTNQKVNIHFLFKLGIPKLLQMNVK